jgi:hypothetical protein
MFIPISLTGIQYLLYPSALNWSHFTSDTLPILSASLAPISAIYALAASQEQSYGR